VPPYLEVRLFKRRTQLVSAPQLELERLEDAQLVAVLVQQQGNNPALAERALGLLWDRLARNVNAVAMRLLHDPTMAEEIVQDTFMKLWQRAGEYSLARGSVAAWLVTMAHHASIDALRRRAVRPQALDDDEATLRVADPRNTAERALEAVNMQKILGHLTPEERLLIELAFLDGLTHVQVAAKTGIALGTVKSRIRGALKRLQAAGV
jgi:RNA polymerase sigma-70 factor, ECF subfamily